MILAILLLVPAWWFLTLWALAWLEEHTLLAHERAAKIRGLLDQAEPEELEVTVAELLRPAIRTG